MKQPAPGNPHFNKLDQCEEKAYDMMFGDARKLFDLSVVKDEIRDKYGRNTFGQSCLMARRLVEHGVPYITINYKGWDTHKQHFETMRRKLPELDAGFATLLQDLAERPEDASLRRRYARAAVAAPFRLIREDPRWLETWGRAEYIMRLGPSDIDELRRLLSEPLQDAEVPDKTREGMQRPAHAGGAAVAASEANGASGRERHERTPSGIAQDSPPSGQDRSIMDQLAARWAEGGP